MRNTKKANKEISYEFWTTNPLFKIAGLNICVGENPTSKGDSFQGMNIPKIKKPKWEILTKRNNGMVKQGAEQGSSLGVDAAKLQGEEDGGDGGEVPGIYSSYW